MGTHYGQATLEDKLYLVAHCNRCQAVVLMTPDVRYSTYAGRNLLDYLDESVGCCPKPDYHYQEVYLLGMSVVCPTCGQEIKEKE